MATTQARFEALLYDKLASVDFQLTKKDVQEILTTIGDIVTKELRTCIKEGTGGVTVRGVGRYRVKTMPARKARLGRNPMTGEEIKIKAKPASKKLVVAGPRVIKEKLKVK